MAAYCESTLTDNGVFDSDDAFVDTLLQTAVVSSTAEHTTGTQPSHFQEKSSLTIAVNFNTLSPSS